MNGYDPVMGADLDADYSASLAYDEAWAQACLDGNVTAQSAEGDGDD